MKSFMTLLPGGWHEKISKKNGMYSKILQNNNVSFLKKSY